jgi:hypothetical protein
MNYPDVIIAGTAKAGTTALYHFLSQHPRIFPSKVKEPRYFAYKAQRADLWTNHAHPKDIVIKDWNAYKLLFEGSKKEQLNLEASPIYLYSQTAALEIKKANPECRLIFILRHPVERAFSHFRQLIGDGRENHSKFIDALKAEEKRIAENFDFSYHYTAMGEYARQLKRFCEHFSRDQMLIIDYKNFSTSPVSTIHQISSFLSLEEYPIDVSESHNVSKVTGNTALQTAIKLELPFKRHISKLFPTSIRERIKAKATSKPKPTKAETQYIINQLRDDIVELSSITSLNTESWLDI